MRRLWIGIGLSLACGLAMCLATSTSSPQTLAQDRGGLFPNPNPDDQPFGPPSLPSGLGMLAAEKPEAAEAKKAAALREELRKAVEEKAALLNSSALEAELGRQRQETNELKALREVQQLQKQLEEISAKYPTTSAGRYLKQMLQQLRNGNQPFPVPEDGFGPHPVFSPRSNAAPSYNPANDAPIRPRTAPRPVPDDAFRPSTGP